MWRQRFGSKYGSKHNLYKGQQFDSRSEAKYSDTLDLLLKAKQIKGYERQVTFPLYAWSPSGDKVKVTTHRPDYLVTNLDDSQEVHEVKGMVIQPWPLKRDLFVANYPEIKYVVIKV